MIPELVLIGGSAVTDTVGSEGAMYAFNCSDFWQNPIPVTPMFAEWSRRRVCPTLPDGNFPLAVDACEADRPVLWRRVRFSRIHDELRHAGHAGTDAARRTIAELQGGIRQRCANEEAMAPHRRGRFLLGRLRYASGGSGQG